MIFKCGHASAKVVEVDENLFAITNLWSNKRGVGDARGVMVAITQDADKKGYDLILVAQEYGSDMGLNNRQLEAFYAKFGFEILEASTPPHTMKRAASREIHAP